MIIHSEYPFPIKKMFLEGGPTLTYVEVGNASKTLVFVHGLGNFIPIWANNIRILRKHYRCLALDLPGHGLSTSDDYPYSIAFYQSVLEEWLKKLELEDIVLIGHSMGGQIAIRTVLENPGLVSHLVLVAPAGFETFTSSEIFLLNQWMSLADSKYLSSFLNFKNYFHRLREKEYDMLMEFHNAFRSVTNNPNLVRTLSRSMKGMLEAPVFDDLAKIDISTLILFGKEDLLIPNRTLHKVKTEDIAQQGSAQIPGSKLKLYDYCGHFLQFEMPSRFNIDVYKFLNPSLFGE